MQIEKGIPIPPMNRRGRKPLVERSLMEIGDSYFKKNGKAPSEKALVFRWSKNAKSKFKFTVRAVDGGVRVWRVA